MAIKKILVIEDDRFIGEMYVRSLKHEGFEVDWVVDGHDGLVAATNKPYDVILLDIMLPEMRGPEILKALRGNGVDKVPNSRIMVMTNFDQSACRHTRTGSNVRRVDKLRLTVDAGFAAARLLADADNVVEVEQRNSENGSSRRAKRS